MKIQNRILYYLILVLFSFQVNAEDKKYTKELIKNNTLLEVAQNVFNVQAKGIVTIGSSKGNLIELYKTLGINNIIWIDSNPSVGKELKKSAGKDMHLQFYSFMASDVNQAQVDGKVETKKIDDFITTIVNKSDYNAMFIDNEGDELKTLKGSEQTLSQIDFIILEIAYPGSTKTTDTIVSIDAYLSSKGFFRADTKSKTKFEGYALYVKANKS